MEAPSREESQEIYLSTIDDLERVREDYGDLSGLKYSIKTYGLIQPIVVTWDDNRWKLIAGGRRYRALTELGWEKLVLGRDVLIREELYDSENLNIQEKRLAIEMEENLKRKDMTWSEQVKGKKALLELMQKIHGVRGDGNTSDKLRKDDKEDPTETGFSIRKLAEVLGESPATVSLDIQLARNIEMVPALAKAETKSAAQNKVKDLLEAMMARKSGIPVPERKMSYRCLVYCTDEADQATICKELEDRGYKVDLVVV